MVVVTLAVAETESVTVTVSEYVPEAVFAAT